MPTLTVPTTIAELNAALAKHHICQRQPNEVQYFKVGGAGVLLTTNLGRKGNAGFFTAPYQSLDQQPKITAFVSIASLQQGVQLPLDGVEVHGKLSMTEELVMAGCLKSVGHWHEAFHLMVQLRARLDITLRLQL